MVVPGISLHDHRVATYRTVATRTVATRRGPDRRAQALALATAAVLGVALATLTWLASIGASPAPMVALRPAVPAVEDASIAQVPPVMTEWAVEDTSARDDVLSLQTADQPRVAGTRRAPQAAVDVTDPGIWDRLAQCESSGNWATDTGNGFYGGLQFQASSWHLVGGEGLPHQTPRTEQISRAIRLWHIQGWRAWPHCSRQLGWR
ncbi:MAG: transglycosylase family protein [Euzebya sp.]